MSVKGLYVMGIVSDRVSALTFLFVVISRTAMGFTLPPRTNNTGPSDHARTLMARKAAMEAEMEAQYSILQSNSVTTDTPLVDTEGFPRADIDVWAVRHARVRIIELCNDHKKLMDDIMVALQDVYVPITTDAPLTEGNNSQDGSAMPFARVDGVAPGSPAASAVSIPYNFSVRAPLTFLAHRGFCGKISSCRSGLSRSPRLRLRRCSH